jgi:hypothetical protein
MIKVTGSFDDMIKQQAIEHFKKNVVPQVAKIYDQAIDNVDAVDTARLKKSSSLVITDTNIKFFTDTEYDKYVILGLGSNRKYGMRHYPLFSAKAVKMLVEKGNFTLPKMQGAKK